MYKIPEINLLEKTEGAHLKIPILTPDLRLGARKIIGDAGLLDHVLKHVASKLEPGGAGCFRRRNAVGKMEYWLDIAYLRKKAGVQDSYGTRPPGCTLGDCPSQDPLYCAKEFRLLEEENARIQRLENADQCNVRKKAGVQDPHWTPGDCPSRDPLCAMEFRLPKGENLKFKRDVEDMVSSFKPQGTFLWPNMGANNGSYTVVVQFEDLSLVHTPPSVSASAPPQLPYHHPSTSPFRPVPGWRAVYSSTNIIAFPRGKNDTYLLNLNDIHDTDGAYTTTATNQHESLSLCSQTWRSCGGAPKRKCKQDDAAQWKKHKKGSNETGKERCKFKDLSIPMVENFDLKIDILDKFQQFTTPVVHQMQHHICGPLSVCDCVGMMFAIQTRRHNPRLASQEITDWIKHFEPYYLVRKERHDTLTGDDGLTSVPLAITDIFGIIKESGVHVEDNYPFVGGCCIKYPLDDVSRYETMRATFKKDVPHERYSIEDFKHLKVDNYIDVDGNIIKEVTQALDQDILVIGMLWANSSFEDLKENTIFDQDLGPLFDPEIKEAEPNHIVLITGYGTYGDEKKVVFIIKNTYGVEWCRLGSGFVAARQMREFAYVTGKVFSTGATPPRRIVVFYTTESSEKIAKEFAKDSNDKYTIKVSDHSRHADVIFIPADLEDYAITQKELKIKLRKESLALFFMDDEPKKRYLEAFYKLLAKQNSDNWLQHLQYAVFGFHRSVAEKTDTGLRRHGARPFITNPAFGVEFDEWRKMIWKKLDKEIGKKKGDACPRAQKDCGPSS